MLKHLTQTFNSEVEHAGVLASVGGHPAFPQSSLLSSQMIDHKDGRTLIWIHNSPSSLSVNYMKGYVMVVVKTSFTFPVPTFAASWICAKVILLLRNVFVPVVLV